MGAIRISREARMITQARLIQRLQDPDTEIVSRAVEELRERGWLQDGSLEGVNLRFSRLNGVDLREANLCRANMSKANLQGANLTNTCLKNARLVGADLREADLLLANLEGTLMVRANLQDARNLRDEQLIQASRLRGATLPDGSLYDGRFNLLGDCADAQLLHINLEDPRVFVEFFGVLMELINKLRSPQNRQVLEAVEQMRARGWLTDGSLRGIGLCRVELRGADLRMADLSGVDFHQANLQGADLTFADLRCAKLTRANMQSANFRQADLTRADLFKADLYGAYNLTPEQLSKLTRLWGAILPDGNLYDGRFNLPGDLEHARWAKVDLNDPQEKARFYGYSLETEVPWQNSLG
jgi:uncharacterized protein YjbI with pentapeptide repeats